jgi:peptide/nickel transport system substrate-binding protein
MTRILARALACVLALLSPAFTPATAHAESVLRYVPVGDLRVLDPIWTSAAITLSHGQMIYDVLMTTDSSFNPKPQMAESFTRSEDGLAWQFRLRPGLVFHDGSPVRAQDVAASIRRWAKRVTAGQALAARASSIAALDDRTLEIRLNRPFGPMLETLASPVLAPFVMREKDAETDAFQQVSATIGSGPFIFMRDEYRPGAKAVYRRNPAYVPRAEPAQGYSGGKIARVDRVEWIYLPDQSTATSALQTGEVDFLESVPADLVSVLAKRPDVVLQVLNLSGSIGTIRPNSAHRPFSEAKARQALLLLVDQAEFSTSMVSDPSLASACAAVFVCGTPYATDIAAAPWRRIDLPRAKQLLAESGYTGEKIVLLDPADQPEIHMIALLTADALRRAGAAVDVQTMDWSTVITRRNTREAPSANPAGWDLAFTLWGGFSLSSPLTNTPLVSSCDGRNLYGWPCDPQIETLRDGFLDAVDDTARMHVAEQIQARYYETVPYVSTGMFRKPVAYRRGITGVLTTPYPVLWNISKAP